MRQIVLEVRILLSKMQHACLDVSISFERPNIDLTVFQLNAIITKALQDLHGEVGAAISIDILNLKQECLSKEYNIILKLSKKDIVKVWSALTLVGSYNDINCCFTVNKVEYER